MTLREKIAAARARLDARRPCPTCKGRGIEGGVGWYLDWGTCWTCEGRGWVASAELDMALWQEGLE